MTENAATTRALVSRGHLGWTVRLLVGIGMVVLVVRSVNVSQFGAVLVAPNWLPLAGMVAAALVFVLLGAVNIWIMLSAVAPVQFVTLLRYFLVATAFGTFTPAAVGDFSLAGFLRRETIPVHRGLSAMLVDRGITLALHAVVFLPLTLLLVLSTTQWLWLPAGVAVGAVILMALNVVPGFRRLVLSGMVRPCLPQLEDFLRSCSDLLRFHPMHLLANVAVTIVRSVVAGVVIELALLAAGTWTNFLWVVVVTNSLSLLNFIPISLGGVGVYEGGAVAVFSRLGLSRERVFAAFVFHRAYIIVLALLLLALSRLLLRRGAVYALAAEAEVKS